MIENIRKQFPILGDTVYGHRLVYLDNAATSQRPQSVIDKLTDSCLHKNANIHRAVHHLANVATSDYESARDKVKDFINANSREEVIFTSGATESINLVAYTYGDAFISKGDEIIVTQLEHHSNIVPWQILCQRKGAVLRVVDVNENGYLDIPQLLSMLSDKTRLVCVSHVSNVLGIINPVKHIVSICHSFDCPVLVDGSQGIVHCPVDVQDIDCDFYVFSGHKMYAATGTGVLYGKRKWLEQMPPFLCGGEMIESVKWSGTTFAKLPQKFEAGTRNFAAVPTFVPAIEFMEGIGLDEEKCIDEVKMYVLDFLLSDKRIKLFGVPSVPEDKIPLFSFCVDGAHHEDLALILDKMGIAVRSGQMCAEPLMDRFGVTGMLRASFAPYNNMEDAHYFTESLDKAIRMLV